MQSPKTRLAAFLTAAALMVSLAAPEAMAKKNQGKKNQGKNNHKQPQKCELRVPGGTCVLR
jgi:hypothetical protein